MRGKKNNNPFLFKQFQVHHHLCAHKVGFDGVLLGAWTNFTHAKTILDIGSGSGLIALMAAQKNNAAIITAIEIDDDSSIQLEENFISSPWKKQLTGIKTDFLTFEKSQTFDAIVSNPPYFIDALATPVQKRTNARHNTLTEIESFLVKAVSHLNPNGSLSIIIPGNHSSQILSILNRANCYLARLCYVYTKSLELPERILIEAKLIKCDVEEKSLYVYDKEGNYSPEYIKLTNEFYINF